MTRSSSAVSASDPAQPGPGGVRPSPAEALSTLAWLWVRQTRKQGWLQWVLDIVLGVVYAVLFGWPIVLSNDTGAVVSLSLVPSWVLFTSALIIRRYAPWPSFLLVIVTTLLKLLLGEGPHLQDIAIFLSIYAAVAYGRRALMVAAGVWAVVVPTLLVVVLPLMRPDSLGWSQLAATADRGVSSYLIFGLLIWLVVVATGAVFWLAGFLRRMHLRAQELKGREAIVELERLRAEELLAIEQERTQIARDMHDVIAHSLAVVVAQADGARYAMKSSPASAEAALLTISTTARTALVDVRGLLGRLRHSQEIGPEPGLPELEALFERLQGAGLQLERETAGEPRPLTAGAENAIFRLVQEALTNVLKHGDAKSPVSVRFEWGQVLDLTIVNALSGAAPRDGARPGTGHGLLGMQERVALAGGNVQADRIGRAFRVTAWVPIAPSAADPEERSTP